MNSMPILFLILTIAACSALYLSHRHQCLLPRPLPLAACWLAYVVLQFSAFLIATSDWDWLTLMFAWLLISMFSFSLMPFVRLLRPDTKK
jgi:hypothetical protein